MWVVVRYPPVMFLQFVFENSTSILREPYSLNRYESLTNALSLLLNDRLHYRYFALFYLYASDVTADIATQLRCGEIHLTSTILQIFHRVCQ